MATDSPAPQDAPPTHCTSITRGGERCRAPRVAGRETCRLHSMTAEERKQAAAKASARSAEKRAKVVEDREAAVEQARLGLTAMMAARLEERADALTRRLEGLALSPDDSIALRGIQLWLERVHGRAVQPTADVTEGRNPLVEAFAALSPEERRAMLRLAQPLPALDPPASAQG